jgi:hypothetical protein
LVKRQINENSEFSSEEPISNEMAEENENFESVTQKFKRFSKAIHHQ